MKIQKAKSAYIISKSNKEVKSTLKQNAVFNKWLKKVLKVDAELLDELANR